MRSIDSKIRNANWIKFIVPFVLLIAYSMWLFRPEGAFATASNVVSTLPEMTAALSTDHSQSIQQLRDAEVIDEYARFQLLDLPYAVLNFLAMSGIIALAMKRFGIGSSPFRYILLAPSIYLIGELFENAALFAVVNEAGGGIPAAIQPVASMTKFAGSAFGAVAALLSLVSLLGVSLFQLFRKNPG